MSTNNLPTTIESVKQLEDVLSRPAPGVIQTMARVPGDLIVLGVGGKTGPSLARMARRASDEAGVRRRVIGVSRFSNRALRDLLEDVGVETIACDLLDRRQLDSLPDAPNVLYLAAMKFGSTGQEPMTWAMNAYLPGLVAEKYASSRFVSYSTGNVYRMMPADSGGSVETDAPGPVGDYAMSCLGRERILTHFSQSRVMPTALVRLNYAHEMRYGIMVDIAQQVLAGQPVDLTMGYFNAIWQGDSNAMTLGALEHVASPPFIVNVAGPETLSVREIAEQFGARFGKPVQFTGSESPDAFLSNPSKAVGLFGPPSVSVEQMIVWIADWLERGGPTHGKPTHFQTRDGQF